MKFKGNVSKREGKKNTSNALHNDDTGHHSQHKALQKKKKIRHVSKQTEVGT